MGWRTSARQMPTVTFPDYGYTQAGIPATVQCPGGMKNRPWADFTAHTGTGGGDVWERTYVDTCIKHDTHFLINALIKISFCLVPPHTSTEAHLLLRAGRPRLRRAKPVWGAD